MSESRRKGQGKERFLVRHLFYLGLIVLLLSILQSCSPAATSPPSSAEPQATLPTAAEPTATNSAAESPVETALPAETAGPEQPGQPTQAPVDEGRLVELEWPERLRMGESDVIRLALVPTASGYVARAEFPDHSLQTKDVTIPRPDGYELYAIARLDGVGFAIEPSGDQERFVPSGEEVAWRWTLAPRQPGQQRLGVQLRLRWAPGPGVRGPVRESQAFARGLDVQVESFLGMSKAQAASTGVLGFILGSFFLLVSLLSRGAGNSTFGPRRVVGAAVQLAEPSTTLTVETPPGLALSGEEGGLLRALFNRYARLTVENEFLSGYSGARTFLVRPIRADGGADALTIVKVGPRPSIQGEFDHYEAFVKDRLPPVTARIQRPPVVVANDKKGSGKALAAVQYTFIAEPGRAPVSLRRALLEKPDPALLVRLFDTFGPHWWMQRSPYTFRMEQEYDALLPPHYVLQPLEGVCARALQPGVSSSHDPANLHLAPGEIVFVEPFARVEPRADGRSLTLLGAAGAGRPALRLRWLSLTPPENTPARVVAARQQLLEEQLAAFGPAPLPAGSPDPLSALPRLLQETVTGTRSVIHGDLNLENILVGPGSLVWLIDFAQTREGHPLFDFAHLESELIAHVLAPRCGSPAAYLELWRARDPLLETLHSLARRCLFDPANPREYHLALFLACMGALKYQNLNTLAKHCLYLTAAETVEKL